MEPITITIPGLREVLGAFHSPLSTTNTIIFPFNTSSKKFTRGIYSAKLTQGRASVDDIEQVFTLFELIISRLDSNLKLLVSLSLRIFIPYCLILISRWAYVFDSSVIHLTRDLYPWYFIIAIGLLIADRATENLKAKADMKKIMEMIGPAYAKRGLSWHISDEFFSCWLELRKEGQNDEEEIIQMTTNVESQDVIQPSLNGKLLVDFEKEENVKYPPILTYELPERGNNL